MHAFPEPSSDTFADRVGLEPEFFPIFRGRDGRPAGRMLLSQPGGSGVLEVLDALATVDGRIRPRIGELLGAVEYPIEGGGRVTFEPGAQVEHSTAVYPDVAAAVNDVADVMARLRRAFRHHAVELAAIGIDIWNDIDTVPQQLRAGRYTAQAAYYRQRGHWGAVMMRHTASLQINLDLGPEGVWQERWLLANLISPLMIASFACSPGISAVCTRARAWQELDPTRSGYPRTLVDGSSDDPREHWGQAALDADVMFYRLGDGRFEPGSAGCSFAEWILEGHPRFGRPTADDLDYHLTTLFFDVRPRGFLELRAGEALPGQWRAVPVALTAALLYDGAARTEAIAMLEGHREHLPELWHRAAVDGVRDNEMRRMACALWAIGLDGMKRLPEGAIGRENMGATERFLEHFIGRGRMPADDLLELDADDPARALDWACG
jgi:glutamate--cysteine ligase